MGHKDPKNIWIFAEIGEEGLREVAFELASEGRRLAEKLREKLCAVVLTGDPEEFNEGLSQYIDTIYYSKTNYGVDAYTHVFSHLIRKYNPRLILMEGTPLGNELASRVAARNDIGIITDCQILSLNNRGCLEVTKMIYGDNVYAIIEAPVSKSLVVTVREGSFDLMESSPNKATELVIDNMEVAPPLSRKKYLEFVKGDPKKIDISKAEIIVASGRGIGGNEELKKIERLAEMLGGSLGGSRVAVDQGWLPFERQVGQTGKTVSPRLFVACGISGAFEFIAGMKDSRLIVAINNDAKAAIFKVSDLSLVGDLHVVIPEILEQLGKLLKEETQ
jgi:electron transfer flavoprotein alpha subunit